MRVCMCACVFSQFLNTENKLLLYIVRALKKKSVKLIGEYENSNGPRVKIKRDGGGARRADILQRITST